MFDEQIKPLEPQDKSDRRNEGGREGGKEERGRRRRGEELGTCMMWRGKRRGRPVQSVDHTCMNSSIMGWNKFPSPQNRTGINGGSDFMALIGYRM